LEAFVGEYDPNVSIVILTWNGKTDTLQCLESIQKLDYPNHHGILVDNGSTDGTVAMVREQFAGIRIIENGRNLGYAEGNNIGIRYALAQGADYIFILNNDTVVDTGAVKELIAAAREHPDAAVFSPKIYCYDPSNQIMFAGARWDAERAMLRYIGLGEEEKGHYESLSETEAANGAAMLLRADVISAVGYFDPRFYLIFEETDWSSRVRRHGYKILFVPTAKVWHKGSVSFGGLTPQYHYYFMRNRLLWTERNLTGRERIRAFVRCAKETYWRILESRRSVQSPREKAILHARLIAWWHYFTRQFGAKQIST
jgi:GT2 family glycosyltransferase